MSAKAVKEAVTKKKKRQMAVPAERPSSDSNGEVLRFEWGFYALSASKAIFRARTYNCITYSVR